MLRLQDRPTIYCSTHKLRGQKQKAGLSQLQPKVVRALSFYGYSKKKKKNKQTELLISSKSCTTKSQNEPRAAVCQTALVLGLKALACLWKNAWLNKKQFFKKKTKLKKRNYPLKNKKERTVVTIQ